MKIINRFTGNIIFEHESDNLKIVVEAAVSLKVSLRSANLGYADLRYADLRYADLRSANLEYANLGYANLGSANLRSANLEFANLEFANLRSANLGYADLRYADLDFTSGLNFSCKTFGIKADMRLAAQIAYHFCRIDFGDCDDAKKAQSDIRLLANKFHRVAECGKIEEPK